MLYIVCGYPASGKSTFCREMIRKRNAIAFDMDALKMALIGDGEHEHRMSQPIGRMLNDVAHWMEHSFEEYGIEDMFLIRMAPLDSEMEEYFANPSRVSVLFVNTEKRVCLERAQARGDFDLQRFGRACRKVDRFLSRYCTRIRIVSPHPLPLQISIWRAEKVEPFPTTRLRGRRYARARACACAEKFFLRRCRPWRERPRNLKRSPFRALQTL